MTEDCLFCRIACGEIPSTEVISTEDTYAFRDIDPQAPKHVLVVPRRHVIDADNLGPQDEHLVGRLFATAREVARKEQMSPACGGSGYRLVFNVGEHGANTVPHLHLHVLGGRHMAWPPG